MSFSSVVERSLFVGPSVPSYVSELSKLISSFKKPIFRQLLTIAVQDLNGNQVTPDNYEAIRKSASGEANFDLVYGALYYLLKCAVSSHNSSLKPVTLKEDLRTLKMPNDFIEDFVNAVSGSRQAVTNLHKAVPVLPKLALMKWRVDVAISTSVLSRVLEPVIVIELKLSNGRSEVFEAKTSQFHKFRFALANLMKEVENLESRSILKH